ncbi:hypothetical protein OQA88_7723 [Cercophora sp. LCS_1]
MGQIFRQAETVWVWLGAEPDHGALKMVQKIGLLYRDLRSTSGPGWYESPDDEYHGSHFEMEVGMFLDSAKSNDFEKPLSDPSLSDTVVDGYHDGDNDFGMLQKYKRECITYNQRAFVDGAGRPGLGPQGMEAGDSIVIFAGDVPRSL